LPCVCDESDIDQQKVTVSYTQLPLEKCLDSLAVSWVCDDSTIKVIRHASTVTINAQQRSVFALMKCIFLHQSHLKFHRIEGNYVIHIKE